MIPDTTTVTAFELSDGEVDVELRRLETPNGERLTVVSEGSSCHLDALALESLTWQDDAFFAELTGQTHDEGAVGGTDEAAGEEVRIGNEYTVIELTRLETDAGTRLKVRSPKLGYTCRLSPAELATIADKRPEFFSDLLRTPLGPEADQDHGGH